MPNSARNIPFGKVDDPSPAKKDYVMGSQVAAVSDQKKPVREKVFNREERYRMLCEIFTHLASDDIVSV